MKDLFFTGGPAYMGILSILLIMMTTWTIYHFMKGYNANPDAKEKALRNVGYGKSIGLFAMIFGILGQLIGLYQAFSAIERAGDISPALVYGGLKVSMITTVYGIFIYLFSLLLWFTASTIIEKRAGS